MKSSDASCTLSTPRMCIFSINFTYLNNSNNYWIRQILKQQRIYLRSSLTENWYKGKKSESGEREKINKRRKGNRMLCGNKDAWNLGGSMLIKIYEGIKEKH